jgi:hypothetical protein
MMCGGFYLLLSAIRVQSSFGMGMPLYSLGGGFSLTSGMVLIPFLIGVVLIFSNARSKPGWLLTVGSTAALIVGVLSSVRFQMRGLSAFELLLTLVLAFGGLGLLLRSLKSAEES